MRCLARLVVPAGCLLLLAPSGCADQPLVEDPPQARMVAMWDPLGCGEPHRVALELEDNLGVQVSRSAPCNLGGITLDVPHWGVWIGRIYSWRAGPDIRSVMPLRLEIDEPIVNWYVDTPQ